MIKDFLISFRDNFKEKTRNPFLGTYFAVWLVRNWELVYTIFNFDNDCKLADKVGFVKNYYHRINFFENLGINILWAFGLLIVTYILLNLSRLIINTSEKRLTPWVYQITDSKSIVLKSVYQNLMAEKDELQLRLDQERESKSKLENRIKKLEEDLIQTTSKSLEKPKEITVKTPENSKKNDTTAQILLKKIKDQDKLSDFLDFSVKMNKEEYVSPRDTSKDYLIQLGL
ncbi:MAG: hypothetical protein ACXVO9_13980, partial [Bacteroidia bacterium]